MKLAKIQASQYTCVQHGSDRKAEENNHDSNEGKVQTSQMVNQICENETN